VAAGPKRDGRATELFSAPVGPAFEVGCDMGRAPKWLVSGGVSLVVLALLSMLFGVPALVRFPLTTNVTAYYRGSFTEYVNQQTLAPLSHPLRLPLAISRQVRTKSGGFSTAVVTEDDTIRPGPMTLHQDFQYLMNRRTMMLVNGTQTQMFSQPAKVDVAGAIRVNFPFGVSGSARYLMWSPETDTTVLLTHGSAPHRLPGISGPQVVVFSATVSGPPSPYYEKWLAANGFPMSISPAQLLPRLQALGVDVPSLLATLLPRLSPSEQSLVTSVLASPVKLDYRYFFKGTVAVDPTTGMMISSDTKSEGLEVTPALGGVQRLSPLLTKYAGVPGVTGLRAAIEDLAAAPPQPAVSYAYVQTPSSAQHMADLAESQGREIHLLASLPWAVGGVGIAMIGIGLALALSRHRKLREPATSPLLTAPRPATPKAA
jgi:hypothetical protein